MKAVFVIAVIALLIAVASALDIAHYAKLASKINADSKATWKASITQSLLDLDATALSNMMGDLSVLDQSGANSNALPLKAEGWNVDTQDLPTNFMAYDKWPQCSPVMKTVHDQSACGSCWAVSVGAAATERYCVKNGQNTFLSSRDILSCCSSCGMGCNGGWPSSAWSYIKSTGIPTGHADNTNTTLCVRYPFLSCKHHSAGTPQCSDYDFSTPSCQKSCDSDSTYKTSYADDKVKAASAYSVSGEANIMKDLYENGPMAVSFTVYEDFMLYTSGVYEHHSGSSLGGHAVTLEGWGVDAATGQKYWVVKNNWNSAWAEGGYFRIVRGTNNCGIEGSANAGTF